MSTGGIWKQVESKAIKSIHVKKKFNLEDFQEKEVFVWEEL